MNKASDQPPPSTHQRTLLNERSGSDLSQMSIKGKNRLPHIILLSNKDQFIGLQDESNSKHPRQLRMENAIEVRECL